MLLLRLWDLVVVNRRLLQFAFAVRWVLVLISCMI